MLTQSTPPEHSFLLAMWQCRGTELALTHTVCRCLLLQFVESLQCQV